ncbi:thiamine pyrophosphate-dependent enzyme [Thermatribacter velox]|jgi:pyruvate ferredoxin oxidoreductase beta subunit|uniref:Thiamine pyrophosphate-dependent enzyme n=1 Tax=Thermatribacter velox TaxID=3039681 RepID=A0ABZ2YDY4_9BACT|nr:pyruvate ferredoxin oxidoreductase beta subunit [Candidatus Atribacteria bacterium]
MPTLKELVKRPERLTPGHRLCAGCGAPIAVRLILAAADKPVIASNATGCLEVATTIFPYTAWAIPWIHNAFENAAATISGVEAMYRAKKKRGEIQEDIYFIAFGGDGGTYDIGLQSLSGALERGHRFVYVCYNNEAYMNTGIQRSSATPLGAWTTTSPVGKAVPGKTQWRKNLTEIVAAHGIPYVAQAAPSNWRDLTTKAEKAFHTDGPAFINVLASCNRGWRHLPSETIQNMQLAVDCCIWPLYEIENGKYRLTYKPKEKKPVEEWLKTQGRFRHLFSPENRHLIDEFQKYVDQEWEKLLKKCEE